MKNAFHTTTLNLRQGTLKAFVPRGVDKRLDNFGNRRDFPKCWKVIHDPSGTLDTEKASFGKAELDVGARFGAWAKGTRFLNTKSGLVYYYDFVKQSIRRLKEQK